MVIKPTELTPATAAALVAILEEAGLPKGVLNMVLGKGRVIGQALADADMDVAVNACLNGAFFSTGQCCTASSRLIVERSVHDEFVEKLTAAMGRLVVGHALEASTQIGPVVDAGQFDKNRAYVEGAKADGAEVVGGDALEAATKGHFMAPALAIATTPAMTINREEVFGPVASTIISDDYDHALSIANDTEFGLSSGICTTSLAKSRHFLRHAQAGMVMVNLPTAGVDPHVPFGGRMTDRMAVCEALCRHAGGCAGFVFGR